MVLEGHCRRGRSKGWNFRYFFQGSRSIGMFAISRHEWSCCRRETDQRLNVCSRPNDSDKSRCSWR
jgi:hypothetical protein